MKPYLLLPGLKKLASDIRGDENIYLGIRPYGFHAGNMLPHMIYPFLLARELEKKNIVPKMNFFVFLNDWEQNGLTGPDIFRYPLNVFPKNTTFQHIKISDGIGLVDYWEDIIRDNINLLKGDYPHIKINYIRNSQMKHHPIMKKHLLYTLTNVERIYKSLREHANCDVLDKPTIYAMAVCPSCKKAQGTTTVKIVKDSETITHTCEACGHTFSGKYESFDYWFYHKPLAIPRLEIFDIDICITGLDHYKEGDYKIRKNLIDLFKSRAKYPRTLYTPVLYGRNGEVMGKSRNNAELIDREVLCAFVEKSPSDKKLFLAKHV